MIVRNVAAPSEDCTVSTAAVERGVPIPSRSSTESPPEIGAHSKGSTPFGQALMSAVLLI